MIQFELELDPPSGDLQFGPMPPLTTVEIADIGAGIPSSYITFDLANFANPYLPTSDVRVTIWDGASPPSTVIYNVAIDLDPAGGFMGWGPYFGGLGGDPLQVEPGGGGIPGTGSGTSAVGELVVIDVVPIDLPTTRIVVDPDVTFDPTLTDPVTVDVVVAGDHQVTTPPPYPENVLISYLTTFTGTTAQTFNMVLSYSGYGIVLDELCWWNGTEWICEGIGEVFDDLAETVSFSITPLTRDGVYEFVLGGNADQEIIVTELLPVEFIQTINETETINFLIDAYDPDGNDLEYSWQVDDVEVSTEASYDFETDYTSAGVYVVTLDVTDNFVTRNELNYTWNVTVNDVSGSGEIIIPNITKLYQNHPNPFNPETNIQFDIKENETGILTIFNTKGQIVASQSFNSGSHIYLWNASNCSSGVYFYKLQTESIIENKKMLLLK